jgi:hypothetical protein
MYSRSLLLRQLLLLQLLLLLLLLRLRLKLGQYRTLLLNFSLHYLRQSISSSSRLHKHTTRVTFSFFATAVKLLVIECSSRSSLIMGSAGTL